MKINFRYPLFSIGIHSGWCERNDSPTKSLVLTRRKEIKLNKYNFSIISNLIKTKVKIPYFVKSKTGESDGLSSGVGSSILKIGDEFFKIKRNGYKDKGFIENKISDRGFFLKNKTIYEKTDDEHGGAMSIEDAEREIRIEQDLIKLGFNLPQKTVSLYKIKLPFQKESYSVALIQKIETDFRADELCMILLTNLFYEVFGENFKINLKESIFQFSDYELKKGLDILNNKYRKIFYNLSKSIGAIYRKLHDEGYLRGIGNSWYGNELICEDGNIGICDLECCFTREEIGDNELFSQICRTDIDLCRTAFYDSMNFFENSLASFVGTILIEGFNDGYNSGEYKKLEITEIIKQIERFISIKKLVIEND